MRLGFACQPLVNPKPRGVHHGGRRSPTRKARTDEAPAAEPRTAPAVGPRTIEDPNLGFPKNRPSNGGQSSFCEKPKPKLTTAHFLTCAFPEPPLAKLPETAFEAQNPSQNDGSPPPESRFRAKRIIKKTWRQRGRRTGGFACFGHALPEQRIVVLGMTERATNAVPDLRFR